MLESSRNETAGDLPPVQKINAPFTRDEILDQDKGQ